MSQGCLIAIDTVRESVIGCSRYTNYEPRESVAIRCTLCTPEPLGSALNAQMKRAMLRHEYHGCVSAVLFLDRAARVACESNVGAQHPK